MLTNETIANRQFDFLSGEVILIDKPFRWSSFKVVHEIRKATGIRKVGHAGTLDPLATGLLILCTGKKTKSVTSYQDLKKTYTGTFLLGQTSETMDLEAELTERKPLDGITREKILTARDKFIGVIKQLPPMYSAVKHKGKSLYHIARKGKTVERELRDVTIYKFEIIGIELPEVHFEIECSKGTYIRVIAQDLGDELSCGAVLGRLRRTAIGEFSVENALGVDGFKALIKENKIIETEA
ncbi:MAG: tRNA pseudouridine(55) synthase TruB [Ignavibacteriaceae bacterium]|nr:tRNA pseudouridine(55) synthase TruB [Ignavibacteriaceae bacterium]